MTLKKYLFIMLGVTVLSWLMFGYVLWTVNPEETNSVGFTLFYSTLFMASLSTTALVGFLIRFIALRQELAFRLVKEAFRQSFLFALLISVSLYLLSRDLFTWLNLFFLVIGLSLLEFFLLSYEKN